MMLDIEICNQVIHKAEGNGKWIELQMKQDWLLKLDDKYMRIYGIFFSFYVCLKLNIIKIFAKNECPPSS